MQNYDRADFSRRWRRNLRVRSGLTISIAILAFLLVDASLWAQAPPKDKSKEKKSQPIKPPVTDDLSVIDSETLPKGFHPPAPPLAIMDLENPIATKEEREKLKSSFHSQFYNVKTKCDLSASGRKIIAGSIRYRLASLSAITPAAQKENPKILPDFLRQFLTEISTNIGSSSSRATDKAATAQAINQEVVKQIPELLQNNFYTRLYAVYILSEMDFAPAYEILLQVIQAKDIAEDEANGQPEVIKIAAANGLIRILRFADAPVRDRGIIANAVINELKKKDSFWWIQMRLIEALRYCEITGVDAGNNNRPFVVECLLSIVKDPERHPRVRSKACYALGRVALPPSVVKIEDVVTAISECSFQLATAATATPTDRNWGWCFMDLYLAFHHGSRPKEKDEDAEKKREGGLLILNKAASQAAYDVIVPIFNDIRAGKAPDAANLKKLGDFVKSRTSPEPAH